MKSLFITLLFVATGFGLAAVVGANGRPPEDPFHAAPEHALLQKLVGTWDASLVTNGPDGKEVRTPGKLTTTAIATFHTADTFEGEMLGLKFQGHGLNGYCTVRKQYFTYWVDSMTSSSLTAYGDFDAAKRELVLKGECLGMSGKLEPCRTVTTFVDENHRNFALFGPGPDGKEMQQLRIEYTRRR